MSKSKVRMTSKRFISYLVAVLMVPALLSACFDAQGEFDQTKTSSFLDQLEKFAEAQEGNGEGPIGPAGPPADTGSQTRPPLPDGGTTVESEHHDDGWNTEKKAYDPSEVDFDEAVDEIRDFYTKNGAEIEVDEFETPTGERSVRVKAYENLGDTTAFVGQSIIEGRPGGGGTTVYTQYPSANAATYGK